MMYWSDLRHRLKRSALDMTLDLRGPVTLMDHVGGSQK